MIKQMLHVGVMRGIGALAAISTALTTASASAASLFQEQENLSSHAWLMVLAVGLIATAVQVLIEVFWSYLEWLLINLGKWQPSSLKAAGYLRFKAGTSLVFGTLLGVLAANYAQLGMLAYFQPFLPTFIANVAPAVDVLLTGLLIGALTAPIHDFFGIVAQLRNMAASNAIKQREIAGEALAGGVLKLAQSEAQTTVDIPGIGPARLAVPGGQGEGDAFSDNAHSTTERYVDLLHNRTAN